MELFSPNIEEGQALARRVEPKYAPAWRDKTPQEQASLAMYFLPHGSKKALLGPTRPRVIKWYCPFASQRSFPSGHRYSINVYTGCAHSCEYCYAAAYEPSGPSVKRDFAKLLRTDLDDLERFNVPPAPVHLSNSTDPFQPLEATAGHTRLALQEVLNHRRRFTSIVVLTKSPRLAVELGCVDLFLKLTDRGDGRQALSPSSLAQPAFCVEVSLAFWREEARQVYDPGAPSVQDRMDGIRRIRQAGVPVVLRIDPLFPRLPLSDNTPPAAYQDFGLPQPQTLDDLERLVAFAQEVGVHHVVFSPAKIVQPRMRPLSPVMRRMRSMYESLAAPDGLEFRGGSWRLPPTVQSAVTGPLLDLCRRYGVSAKCCKQNLIETP
jgi:DNA repair photolyase